MLAMVGLEVVVFRAAWEMQEAAMEMTARTIHLTIVEVPVRPSARWRAVLVKNRLLANAKAI